jgi:hypothetical protein
VPEDSAGAPISWPGLDSPGQWPVAIEAIQPPQSASTALINTARPVGPQGQCLSGTDPPGSKTRNLGRPEPP